MKRLTDWVSEGFIWGVGITRPKPGRERLAAWFITGALVGSVVAVAAVFFFLLGKVH